MKFFWRQPTYQSDLDLLLAQLAGDDPTLAARKEAGLKRLWGRASFHADSLFPGDPVTSSPLADPDSPSQCARS